MRWLTSICVLLGSALGLGCASSGEEPPPGPDPTQRLPGGDTTNTLLFGQNSFTLPAANISAEHEAEFYTGNSFFNQAWVQPPSSTDSRDGLGPLFNARSCSACHFKDGRGRPPESDGEDFVGLLLRLSVPAADGTPMPDPVYGGQLQPFALPGVPLEGSPRVSTQPVPGQYDDGEAYELSNPSYRIDAPGYGPLPAGLMISPRVAPATIGMGLLEAIPESRLEQLADPDDADGDGISGRVQRVTVQGQSELGVGRFGWKAEQPSVAQQAAGAFLGDMGITSPLFPSAECSAAQPECNAAISGGQPEISDKLFERVALYTRLLAVPERPRWDDTQVLQGQALFSRARCDACHTPRHVTASDALLPELAGQVIWPYTDLLLHDMGDALSDQRPSALASGPEWRTPPLWGLGRYETVNGHQRLMHDGRARGSAEAILWHAGEAQASRDAFVAMSRDERDALIAFIESL